MNYEKVDSGKIEALFRKNGLLEVSSASSILKKKNTVRDRKTSYELYRTVVGEIERVLTDSTKINDIKCKPIKERFAKKRCKKETKRKLIGELEQIKKQCASAKYHVKRCTRRCDTLINYIKKEIDS